MQYVVGIDAGGSKTMCLLADESGQVLAESRADGANLSTSGAERVEASLRRAVSDAIGGRPIAAAVVCIGMAGADRASDAEVIRTMMGRISPGSRVIVANDALVALAAGSDDAHGIVIISGTGSIVYGRDRRNRTARAGGWGYILGDEGSGYWIGRHALTAVMRAADGRGPQTALTPAIFEHFGVDTPHALDHAIYHGESTLARIAALGALVERAREQGDRVAADILERAADELVLAAQAVMNGLEMAGERFSFVLAGGMIRAVPSLAGALEQRLPRLAARADVRRLEAPPAAGAVRLALAALRES